MTLVAFCDKQPSVRSGRLIFGGGLNIGYIPTYRPTARDVRNPAPAP